MLTESTNNLTYEKLSKDEMAQRGILGRLVGICADFMSPTRNGRKYPEKLWENIFNSDIMKERIANGVCFGELGHPADREETDMEKICICMPEEPKKGPDGKLRAVFDILDTPNGRILKSLCDYGSTLGISSRGSGDLETDFNGQESVNPDTYNCEGFDIVLLPGVKDARLQYVTESLDKKRYNKTLREKLQESIDRETEEHKKIMTESLNILGIELNESPEKQGEFKREHTTSLDEAWNTILTEAKLSPQDKMDMWYAGTRRLNIKACSDAKLKMYYNICVNSGYSHQADLLEKELVNRGILSTTSSSITNKEPEKLQAFMKVLDDEAGTERTLFIVKNEPGIKFLKDLGIDPYDFETVNWSKLPEAFAIKKEDDNAEFIADELLKKIQNEEVDILKEDFDMGDSIDNIEVDLADDNDMAITDELQEALRLNKKLDEKIVSLQEKLSACYAKEMKLEESIDSYKIKIAKLSNKSKENKALTEKLSKLENELKESKSQIADKKNTLQETMQRDAKERKSLKESLTSKDKKIKELSEKLENMSKKVSTTTKSVNSLNEQLETAHKDNRQLKEKYSKRLEQTNQLVEKYKKIAKNAVDKYINRQATILGVTSQEIKNRLPESYSFNDIDMICESLREYRVNINSLPFSTNNKLNENIGLTVKNIDNRTLINNSEDELSEADIKLAEKFIK